MRARRFHFIFDSVASMSRTRRSARVYFYLSFVTLRHFVSVSPIPHRFRSLTQSLTLSSRHFFCCLQIPSHYRVSSHFIIHCHFVWIYLGFLLHIYLRYLLSVIDLICYPRISRRTEHWARHISIWISCAASVRAADIVGRYTRLHSVCGHRHTGSSTMGKSNVWRGIHCHQTIKFEQRSSLAGIF